MKRNARPAVMAARATTDEVHVRRLMRRVAPLLQLSSPATVAILARAGSASLVTPWLHHFAADAVHVVFNKPPARQPSADVHVAASAGAVDKLLHRIGTLDVLIDLRAASIERYTQTWAAAAFHVRSGGLFIARPSNLRWSRAYPTLVCWAGLLGGAAQVELAGRSATMPLGLDPDVTGSVLLFPEALVLVKRGDHLLFIRDEDALTVPRREPDLTVDVLAETPAGTLHGKAKVRSHTSTRPVGGLQEHMPFPRLQVRHYRGRIEFSGQTLLVAGHSILPDSHRFFRQTILSHPLTTSSPSNPLFARRPDAARPQERLPGTYYVLDPQYTGHYGHLMTEAVPRLWWWDSAKARFPELKVLVKIQEGTESEPILDRLLPAFGIDLADIVYVDHPVELESIITAAAMWHNYRPHFAHPDIRKIWHRIGQRLIDKDAPNWERIFLTRAPGSLRTCHNASDVEALFASYGFQIVRPEEFELGVQAGFFRTAKCIAGFAGSQMFNMMYTEDLRQLIVLAQESYVARNEHLYAALLAEREDWFWSRPDKSWFHSGWTFDFERNGAELEKLLASL